MVLPSTRHTKKNTLKDCKWNMKSMGMTRGHGGVFILMYDFVHNAGLTKNHSDQHVPEINAENRSFLSKD